MSVYVLLSVYPDVDSGVGDIPNVRVFTAKESALIAFGGLRKEFLEFRPLKTVCDSEWKLGFAFVEDLDGNCGHAVYEVEVE